MIGDAVRLKLNNKTTTTTTKNNTNNNNSNNNSNKNISNNIDNNSNKNKNPTAISQKRPGPDPVETGFQEFRSPSPTKVTSSQTTTATTIFYINNSLDSSNSGSIINKLPGTTAIRVSSTALTATIPLTTTTDKKKTVIMKGGRRRVLSTFQIPKSDPRCSWPRPLVLPSLERPPQVTSAVRRRHALNLGLSPQLSRQVSDIRLLHNRRRGWGVGLTDQLFDPTGTNKGQRLSTVLDTGRNVHQASRAKIRNPRPFKNAGPTNSNPSSARFRYVHVPKMASNQAPGMLRRPTVDPVAPVVENGPLFHLLIRGKELKPLCRDGNDESDGKFYSNHFPLLLRKFSNSSLPETGKKKVMTESDVEEQLRLSERRCRARQIWERIKRADDKLRKFETDPEDFGPIETELRTELFNPTTWNWNLERYSLDTR
ncbi:LOW QUALITY PROTEIN: hypothetical protein PoB_000134600 [Plakobranchus ocellatus]|uniref:Uncharacterized protein n=1 Tax=Plakobranchus ocellatus TaxID=259542 RepID=A0AAV3WYR9_9GAST|nr:LOW QUALITY PROTEIN: hypothetical protein PoB_000134600 [Plakobranchus ocellatus]